jgi:hypothetical protein
MAYVFGVAVSKHELLIVDTLNRAFVYYWRGGFGLPSAAKATLTKMPILRVWPVFASSIRA